MVGIRQFYKSGYLLFWHCSTVSLFLHWQIFHTTVMLSSHPDPGWIVMISIFITSLIHVMSSGHRWILAQFHYDLIYTHVICNQIKKRYYHKSVHISNHICSQMLHWSELCSADIFSGVHLRSQRKYAVWPDSSPWSGLAGPRGKGDRWWHGPTPWPRNKKLSRISTL